jgi:hypothetical protein
MGVRAFVLIVGDEDIDFHEEMDVIIDPEAELTPVERLKDVLSYASNLRNFAVADVTELADVRQGDGKIAAVSFPYFHMLAEVEE